MSVFHVGPNGPGKCSAVSGKCPFGGETGDENHYTSQVAANKAYEAAMEAEAHKPITKPIKAVEPKDFKTVMGKLYRSSMYSGYSAKFMPLAHVDLMAIPRDQFKDYMDAVDGISLDNRDYAIAAKEKEIFSDTLWKAKGARSKFGPKTRNPDGAAKLDVEIADLQAQIAKLDSHMNGLSPRSGVPEQYMMAKTAYELTAPSRTVDGLKLNPGEGIVRGLYNTKGDFLGVVNLNLRAPNQGFSAVSTDGTRTPFKLKGGKPEVRYNNLKADGYVIGRAIVPVSLFQADGGKSYHRAKTASKSLETNPARGVAEFDQGPQSWANLVEKQEARIE